MLDVVNIFREQGTVDELGVGRIRDALADHLFPGTSTIQTRARYMLFVPWIYQALEARKRLRVAGVEVAHLADVVPPELEAAIYPGGIDQRELALLDGIELLGKVPQPLTLLVGEYRFEPGGQPAATDVIQ